ncbi:hypothetical protein CHS0354_032513 [Potamilus streckersoni]|uniref:Galectin n=1 Tax=Potamilus streckersoni TaxID=2493646 RepID=A0AAE0SQC4_9BIVA|nr:hypothetical protein CHS0354_032513 [Potamilus streckersoni]
MPYFYINKNTPFITPCEKMEKIREVHFKGTPKAPCTRFNVNFQHGTDHDPKDIDLHFDVRFNHGSSQRVVLCNDRRDGVWRNEEREKFTFPFSENEEFYIKIELYDNCYRVLVGEVELLVFDKRKGAKPVDTFRIDGDVHIKSLKII